jgi:single-strand DNA-binding protein
MAYSFNRVILLGNMGQDAETRTTPKCTITTFSLATSESYKKKDSEDWQTTTEWHRVTAFNLPESYTKKLTKGAKLLVEGKIKYEEYNDQDGQKKKVTKIYANQIVFADRSKKEGEADSGEPIYSTKVQDEPDNDLPF